MSAIDESSIAPPRTVEPVEPAPSPGRSARRLRILRWVAIAIWATVIIYRTVTVGFAFNRELVLLYVCSGLAVASIGQGRRMLYIIRDWLPFALVLIAYDLSRGAADMIGRPTLWEWPADVDRWLFSGTMPTVWLQEQLKLPEPPWWEVVISSVYMSFFILPYVVAAVLWLRDREEWKVFVKLFVGLSVAGLAIYAVCLPRRHGPPPAARRPISPMAPPIHGACSGRRAVCPTVACSARCSPRTTAPTIGSNGSSAEAGATEPALGDGVARPGPGQRQPRRGHSVPARRQTAAVAMFLWNRVHRGWRPLLVIIR